MSPIIREVTIGPCRLIQGDCLECFAEIEGCDSIITDPPYGMNKGAWDKSIPNWMERVHGIPIATFCGVVGMRDYPTADWVGAWVRVGSVQRNGRLKGFSNWEPILFYNIDALSNDVISCPNIHEDTGHPTTKPTRLMERLIERIPGKIIFDPFMGSGTTGVACIMTERKFIGIEKEPKYFDIAVKRIQKAWDLKCSELPFEEPVKMRQRELMEVLS